jgi:Tol biopolymer transport system component
MIFAWQEDEIIAWFFPDGPPGAELVGISAVDGTVRVIRVFGADWYETVRGAPLTVSPDGDFLTYGRVSPQGDADVVILRAADGAEVDRVEGPANDIAVAWTPNGGSLLFHSDRQMTEGIWRVRIDGGRIAGEPDLVRGDLWNSVPIGPSRDAYFFGVKTDVRRVRVAAFDPETGMMLSEPTAVSGVITEPSRAPIWSPDGQAMAYVKDGPPNLTAEGLEGSILVVRSLFGPDAREIPLHGKKLMDLLAWTSDGRIVGSGLSGEQRNAYAWSIDLESGRIDTLVGGNEPLPRALSPDGRTHYYFREDGHAMVAMDSATRRERTVVEFGTEHGAERFYLSPDGKTLAFILVDPNTGNSVLAVAPASGGSLRELFRRAVPDGISTSMGVFWAPNRDQLFFSTHGVPDTDEPERIWKVDYSEAEPEVTEVQGAEGLKGAEDLVIHPESSRIAFVGGEERSEIWMMTNLGGGGH